MVSSKDLSVELANQKVKRVKLKFGFGACHTFQGFLKGSLKGVALLFHGAVYVNNPMVSIMPLCEPRPCLLTGPDTGDSSSSLERHSEKSSLLSLSIYSLILKPLSNIKHMTYIVH